MGPASHRPLAFAFEYDEYHIHRSEPTPKEPLVKTDNAIGLVTGANRGIGLAFTHELRRKNMLKRNSMRFAAALLVALASLVAAPNAALAAAPQHRDQVPGFYRLMVGDIEVTALFDGSAVFDPHWLHGKKVTMDGVAKSLHEVRKV